MVPGASLEAEEADAVEHAQRHLPLQLPNLRQNILPGHVSKSARKRFKSPKRQMLLSVLSYRDPVD